MWRQRRLCAWWAQMLSARCWAASRRCHSCGSSPGQIPRSRATTYSTLASAPGAPRWGATRWATLLPAPIPARQAHPAFAFVRQLSIAPPFSPRPAEPFISSVAVPTMQPGPVACLAVHQVCGDPQEHQASPDPAQREPGSRAAGDGADRHRGAQPVARRGLPRALQLGTATELQSGPCIERRLSCTRAGHIHWLGSQAGCFSHCRAMPAHSGFSADDGAALNALAQLLS